jgi:hypothetical protein
LITNLNTKFSIIGVIADLIPDAKNPYMLDIQSAGSAFLASGDSTNSKPYNGGPENYKALDVFPVECHWGN